MREKKEADSLKERLQTKAGEADTLRRRRADETRRHEQQAAEREQQYGAELARLRAEIEKLRRDKESAQTDSLFAQHDLREVGMAQRTRKAMPSRPKPPAKATASPAGTPRRANKTQGLFGDGFDDDDVVMASPSKLRDRRRTATPKQAGKRKRPAVDQSPIPLPALQLSEPRNPPKEKEPEPASGADIGAALLHFRQDDGRFRLLHSLLSHPSSRGEERILEALTQHTFPSQPSKKLSALVYDALAAVRVSDVHELALRLCQTMLDLWKRCLDERYYAPHRLLLDALFFILTSEPVDTAVRITDQLLPLLVSTVDLVALPISNAAKLGGKAMDSLRTPTQRDIAANIDVLDCLELLHLLATSCVSSFDLDVLTRFWQNIPASFVLMLLNKEHPQPQITLMLRILSTSALSGSIGPLATEDEGQANIEDALIARLTNIFTEVPKPIHDSSAPMARVAATETEVWELRLSVLMVLTQFSIEEHGSVRLAQNPLCVGRLIKYLDYSINALYQQPLSPTQNLKVESVNATMKLISHIATSNPGFDVKGKLVNTLGGHHAYTVALSRLTFSEGLVLESGIEEAVTDMAHDVLDEHLTMDEGEALGMVFSSGNSV